MNKKGELLEKLYCKKPSVPEMFSLQTVRKPVMCCNSV